MTKRLDGLTDWEDLTPEQQEQARAWCASMSILTAADAEQMAFRVAKTGRVSRSYKDKDLSTKRAATLDAELRALSAVPLSNDDKVSGSSRTAPVDPYVATAFKPYQFGRKA